jgi:hypothetical protein
MASSPSCHNPSKVEGRWARGEVVPTAIRRPPSASAFITTATAITDASPEELRTAVETGVIPDPEAE